MRKRQNFLSKQDYVKERYRSASEVLQALNVVTSRASNSSAAIPTTVINSAPVNLSSSVGIDYGKLRNLLVRRQWKEADRETARVMLKVAGTYAYYEIAERALVEVTPGEKFLFQGFKGANAQQLFEMTRKFE